MMKKTKKKILLAIAAAVIAVGGALLWAASQLTAAYGYEAVRVNIPAGCTDAGVDSILRADLGKDFGAKVARIWRFRGGSAVRSHGSYLVEPGMPAWRVARNIRRCRQTPVRFTFNNLRTLDRLAARADEMLELTADDFLAAADSLLSQRGYSGRAEYPAAFLPDSYEFYWTASPAYVVKTLADHRDRFWTPARRERAAALGLTPVQVATIASIAEEETASAEERGIVGRLYINRLHRGMRLQADPTVKFAVGDFSLRRITGVHLAVESPYNTYRNNGLPPGPIRIPDAATLRAVLDAKPHSYIYMCAKEDFSGRHNFATDLAAHNANARRYRQALDRRGIK